MKKAVIMMLLIGVMAGATDCGSSSSTSGTFGSIPNNDQTAYEEDFDTSFGMDSEIGKSETDFHTDSESDVQAASKPVQKTSSNKANKSTSKVNTVTKAEAKSWSDTHETAPMPEKLMEAEDIIGKWVDDPESVQPHIIEIWKEGDQLKYKYYRIVPGNGAGINLANEVTEWGYSSGKVVAWEDRAQFECMAGETGSRIYTAYYYMEETDQIVDQKNGNIFYHMNDYEYGQ